MNVNKVPMLRQGPPQEGFEEWSVVIPFKGSPQAKSRLGLAYEEYLPLETQLRHRLARAFLLDTVTATTQTESVRDVIVVTSDPEIRAALTNLTVIPDPGQGLNAAFSAGLDAARERKPRNCIAAMTGDLPSLEPEDLDVALQSARNYSRGVVPDHLGIGTTMVTALAGVPVIARFGGSSFDAHQQNKHVPLPIPLHSTLRQDVDTPRDLERALQQGVGAATQNAMQAAPNAQPHAI